MLLDAMALFAANSVALDTGTGVALQRVSFPLVVPTNQPAAALRFDVAFATEEQIVGGEFVDSFTVTLRTTNRAHVATVLTVDRFGVAWVPGGPGGLLDPIRDFFVTPAEPFFGNDQFPFQIHYNVLVQIPPPFLAQPSVLVVTLFDNEDAESSRASLSNLEIRPGTMSLLTLQSSASPAGPYQREPSAVFNPIARTVTVPRAGAHRLFRLRGDTNSRVTRFQIQNGTLLIDYDKEIGQPVLRLTGANTPDGPFLPVSNAVFDLDARKVFVPLLNAPGFFRMAGSHPARIINDEVSGEQRILEFEVAPIPPRLESSSVAAGPYTEEPGVVANGLARQLRLPVGGINRFYRINSDVPTIVREISVDGNNLVIKYAAP